MELSRRPDEKFCGDCGAKILIRAEICPHCGCRQTDRAGSRPQAFSSRGAGFRLEPVPRDPITSSMVLLLFANFFWNGLGNLAIRDRRGWGYVLANILFFVIGLFTAFIPTLLFYAFCGYQGYLFLRSRVVEEIEPTREFSAQPPILSLGPLQPSIYSPATVTHLYCSGCGTELTGSGVFCQMCGQKIAR